jgi:hypothetical protein
MVKFVVLEKDTAGFAAHMRRVAKRKLTHDDKRIYCMVLDMAKEKGLVDFDRWRTLNNLIL